MTETLHQIDTMYGPGMSDVHRANIRRNRLFTMTKDGHAQSLSGVDEMLMIWNKGCVPQADVSAKCDRSKHVMVAPKCGYESFGKRKAKSPRVNSACEYDISKLYSLLERSNIFPSNPTVKRKMNENFFWDHVERPEKVGSKKDSAKSTVVKSELEELIENNLCKSESERNDYIEFELNVEEDDNENVSCCSTIGEDDTRESNNDGLEDVNGPEFLDLDDTVKDTKINDALKHVGNV